MYSTCLFCHGALGRNAVIEHFPIGRRLAFDEAKGRLWVVCTTCERWNLTPLEARWEAIEECEKAFRGTRLRASSGEIGLARVAEGLELVRIGAPLRPEMAAWRYGDQFGRRRRREMVIGASAVAAVGIAVVAGPIVGLAGGSAAQFALQAITSGRSLYLGRKLVHLTDPEGEAVSMRYTELDRARLFLEGRTVRLEIKAIGQRPDGRWWQYDDEHSRQVSFRDDDAMRAMAALLPPINRRGGSKNDVSLAVSYLDQAEGTLDLVRSAVDAVRERATKKIGSPLKSFPTAGRLALEMATHEASERRALDGELERLNDAWRNAEEIAAIADDLLLPDSVRDNLARLKKDG